MAGTQGAPSLTDAQRKLLRARVRAGADLVALQSYAKEKGITAGRSTLYTLLKAEQALVREVVATQPKPAAPEELAERVAELAAQVSSLRGRLDGLLHVPRVRLSEVANAAVDIARQMLTDPDIDASAKTKVMAQMPDLIDSARKALEAERGGDEDLGG